MKRGVWHQCGHNGQLIAAELLEANIGVGAIVSPKDVALPRAVNHSERYRDAGASVLLDPQFYEPQFADGKLGTYPTTDFRKSVRTLTKLQTQVRAGLSKAIEEENRTLRTAAVVAPALPYEADRQDIVELNARLFDAAKSAGDAIGVPTYATVVLGRSATNAKVAQSILSGPTDLQADGWYYGFEFEEERLPTDAAAVFRYAASALVLACTKKPVLHAWAGPLANISFGAGARGAAIGIWQNLWGFDRTRWQPTGERGGGAATPRFFSVPLWGTIVHPDETGQLSAAWRQRVMQLSPYSQMAARLGTHWSGRDAQKHMVHVITEAVAPLAKLKNARRAMNSTVAMLRTAAAMHRTLQREGIQLRDNTGAYQAPWSEAGGRMLNDLREEYDYLEEIGGP